MSIDLSLAYSPLTINSRWNCVVQFNLFFSLFPSLPVYLSLERDPEVKASLAGPNALDMMLDGYVFRASLSVFQESSLLGLEGERVEKEEVGRWTERAPTHHRLIQACHAANPLYGRVVRLCSIWLSNHLLPPIPSDSALLSSGTASSSPCLPLEALELLVAALFSPPGRPPGSLLAGLLAFLSLLSTHDWHSTPLLVDPHHTLLPSDHEAAEKAFEKHQGKAGVREGGGSMMYLLAPYDKERGWRPSWTSSSCPEPVILARMKALAAISLQSLLTWMEEGGKEGGWRAAVVPSSPFQAASSPLLQPPQFDVLIRFKPAWVGPLFSGPYREGWRAWEEVQKGCKALRCGHLYKNLAGAQAQKRVVGMDPVSEYQKKLVKRYGGLALFFMAGAEGGHREGLAVRFRPRLFLSSSFSVLQSRGKIPIKVKPDEEKRENIDGEGVSFMLPNVGEVLSDFKRLGEEIVEEVLVL